MALLKLAARNLARNRRRTAISLVALVVGVAAVVMLRGFINGQRQSILSNLVEGQLGAVQIHRQGYLENVLSSPLTLDLEDSEELRRKIRAVPGVKAVAGRIQFAAMLSTPDAPVGEREPTLAERGISAVLIATGVEPQAERLVCPRRQEWLGQGRMLPSADSDEVMLNAEFAASLRAVPLPPGAPRPPIEQMLALLGQDRDGLQNGENVVLGGTILSATPGDKKVGWVPLKTAQRLLRMEGRVTEYVLSVEHLEDAPKVRDAVSAALGPGYEVHTWDQIFPFIRELTGTQDVVFGIVTLVFLVVALTGVVNAMLMNVLERVREIGTMLAVGVRRRQVVQLFLLEGLVLGALGGAFGVGLGFAAVQWMHQVGLELPAPGATTPSVIRPFVSFGYMGLSWLLATVGSGVATLWPALRASSLRPVEALQKP